MTVPSDHLDDDTLSSLLDNQTTPGERSAAETHLSACAVCEARLDDFRSVVTLVRGLPEVDPPRDFTLGPRLVVDPPNVIRLRRWYTATRVAAASLAAVFAFLAAGTLYVDSRPAPAAAVVAARPAAVSQSAGGAAQSAPPTASVAVRSAAAPAPAAAQRPSLNAQADDQVAAATSVNPLPTPIPTVAPTPVLIPVTAPVVAVSDPGASLRNAAVFAGLLAVLALFAALLIRHRLPQT